MSFYLVFRSDDRRETVEVGPIKKLLIQSHVIRDAAEGEDVSFYWRGRWYPFNLGQYWGGRPLKAKRLENAFDNVEVLWKE